MSKKKLMDALDNPLVKAKASPGLLAKLFWIIVSSYNIRYRSWSKTMRNYVNNPLNGIEQTSDRRDEHRNNLVSALLKDNPTWLTWSRGLKAIDIRKIRITVETWRGEEEEYQKSVVSSVMHQISDAEEEEDEYDSAD